MQKITEKITVAGHTAELMGYTIEKKNDWGVQDMHATIIICPGGGYHFCFRSRSRSSCFEINNYGI